MQNGFLDQIGCKNFTEGCPKDNYRSTDLYKYPACHRLNTKDRCYVADPSCKTFTMPETSTPDTSVSVGIIIGIFGPLLMLLGILFITFVWRRRQKRKQEREDVSKKDSDQIELLDEHEQYHPKNLQMKEDAESCTADQKDEAEKTYLKEELYKGLDKIFNKTDKIETRKILDKELFQEIENYLKNLKDEIETLILKWDKDSADRAARCIDHYSNYAILGTKLYVLEKQDSCDHMHASTSEGPNYIEEANKADSKMIESITKSSFEKVFFLTQFNPKKIEYFSHLISEKGIKLQLDKEDDFCTKTHLIRSVKWPQWHMKMGWDIKGSIWSSTKVESRPCKFIFIREEKGEIDNIFYIKSFRYPDYYIVMKEGIFNFCESVQGSPGPEGQWKIIRFFEGENPCYVISPLSKPSFFIYMTSGPFGLVRGTDDLQEIRSKGVWHIIDADSKN